MCLFSTCLTVRLFSRTTASQAFRLGVEQSHVRKQNEQHQLTEQYKANDKGAAVFDNSDNDWASFVLGASYSTQAAVEEAHNVLFG